MPIVKNVPVHKIVATAFIGPIPAGMEINHRDGDKKNNTPGNLEYVTHAENQIHAAANGLYLRGDNHPNRLRPERMARGNSNGSRLYPERLPRGESHYSKTNPELVLRGSKNGKAKLNEAMVADIKRRLMPGENAAALARVFSVHRNTIYLIRDGKNWAHVSVGNAETNA